jgi:hypothetical protein
MTTGQTRQSLKKLHTCSEDKIRFRNFKATGLESCFGFGLFAFPGVAGINLLSVQYEQKMSHSTSYKSINKTTEKK